jgi:purine-binding chemotaxis protein CheW
MLRTPEFVRAVAEVFLSRAHCSKPGVEMNQTQQPEAGTSVAMGPQMMVEESLQIVSFRVGQEEFGLDILRVQEIIRHQHLTRVPNAPDCVDGVINLRGKVIPVIALRKRFGMEQQTQGGQSRIVVLEVQNMVLGFIVDSVPEVLRISSNAVVPLPRLGKVEREYVSGVAKLDDRLLILLDVDRIMSSGETRASAVAQV